MAAWALFRTARTAFPKKKFFPVSSCAVAKIHLWDRFLNPIFNKVDEKRIEEFGPDRTAAEWILRCGGAVRSSGLEKYHEDYNLLPPGRMVLEAIDATDACVIDIGFTHLKNLKHLKELDLTHCESLDDNALRILAMYQKDYLQKLRIVSCGGITEAGLGYLVDMKALRSLFLARLAGVENPGKCLDLLKGALPECHIEFPTGAQLDDESH